MALMDATTFLNTVIIPALTITGTDDPRARKLLLGTGAQESGLRSIVQDHGPAIGPFQMEPVTHDDIWKNFLADKPVLVASISRLVAPADRGKGAILMLAYPQYAAAMCRMHYLRVPSPLPSADDLPGQAAYWKQHYNTPQGAGTVEEYIANYQRIVGDAA
jgi:hypothetical protein